MNQFVAGPVSKREFFPPPPPPSAARKLLSRTSAWRFRRESRPSRFGNGSHPTLRKKNGAFNPQFNRCTYHLRMKLVHLPCLEQKTKKRIRRDKKRALSSSFYGPPPPHLRVVRKGKRTIDSIGKVTNSSKPEI
ncbi:hypothetical protein CEXT_180661 [Caerostris extrusa]|uniref:Uncharacterized protein n=1 Tax=Caerostris extrusa TaxID=172846 RepID=A0AAV4XIF9_CAEEX|nr:hypothetical protein CEXT_180661 [Caerostris extrusa]